MEISINSEVGKLEAVIVHRPGPEVEKMTPVTAERALYSDILNLAVASREYEQLYGVLDRFATTYEIRDLLCDILSIDQVRQELLFSMVDTGPERESKDVLYHLSDSELATQLIEGVPLLHNSLTNFLNKEKYSLPPLHNFFFTRDPSFALFDKVIIANMAKPVRSRETSLLNKIFTYHPVVGSKLSDLNADNIREEYSSIEGGDVQVISKDILLIGIGARTTSKGIDKLIGELKAYDHLKHVIVQELPRTPESFIHLDMVFTVLDHDICMVYEPFILRTNKYNTVVMRMDHGKIQSIDYADNILEALANAEHSYHPMLCGGDQDTMIQEREQWHSGANFFALAPGVVIGYERNVYTNDELNKHGFNVITARDIVNNNVDTGGPGKTVITIEGSELSRGGGGPRCMTMPLRRERVIVR